MSGPPSAAVMPTADTRAVTMAASACSAGVAPGSATTRLLRSSRSSARLMALSAASAASWCRYRKLQ